MRASLGTPLDFGENLSHAVHLSRVERRQRARIHPPGVRRRRLRLRHRNAYPRRKPRSRHRRKHHRRRLTLYGNDR